MPALWIGRFLKWMGYAFLPLECVLPIEGKQEPNLSKTSPLSGLSPQSIYPPKKIESLLPQTPSELYKRLEIPNPPGYNNGWAGRI